MTSLSKRKIKENYTMRNQTSLHSVLHSCIILKGLCRAILIPYKCPWHLGSRHLLRREQITFYISSGRKEFASWASHFLARDLVIRLLHINDTG